MTFLISLTSLILVLMVGYQVFQINKKQTKAQSLLNQLINDINVIKLEINKINQSVYGVKTEHDDKLWGGLEGALGTKGKTEFLDEKLDSLIEVLNTKFIDLGKKLDEHKMMFGESLYWEVMNNKLLKNSNESTSSSTNSSA